MKHHYYATILIRVAFFSLLLFNYAKAQPTEEKKIPVGIYEFLSNNTGEGTTEAKKLSAIVTEILSSNGKFDAINRTFSKQVQEEQDLNKREEFLMSEIAEQGKQTGAIKIITGRVINISPKERDQTEVVEKIDPTAVVKTPIKMPVDLSDASAKSVDIYLYFEIRMIDVATNKIESSENFDVRGTSVGAVGIGASIEDATKKANRKARRNIATWITGLLPYDFVIVRGGDTNKKNEPTTVLIKGGDNMGLEKNLSLKFFDEEIIDGEVRLIPVGDLEIFSVEPTFSQANVTSGRAELKKMLDAGKKPKLQIVEKEKK